ncbi:MAG: hydantoinase B/oxoprolinase family protein [Gammaproteobacteria bacterium]|nr:hydantoinase B/oxoprolinase family protein [Gammaproteobacteria bacterium]
MASTSETTVQDTVKSDPPVIELELHTGTAERIDPVTFEVIKNNLWNINIEHGTTLIRTSGSLIVAHGRDLNPCILTEDVEYVFAGPYVQIITSAADLATRWVMDNLADNPGIREGDMFLSNDPWIGATHQMDVTLICPVFVEGRIFCWTVNTMHQNDVGGVTPGGMSPEARDSFYEPVRISPVRIVEQGRLREDLEEMYLRQSRLPGMLGLDLRAAVSGNLVAQKRILELVDRYGAGVVKGVMRRIIDHAEKTFSNRLSKLPDGTWRARGYLEQALPGDRGIYPLVLTMRKTGSDLVFGIEGTHEQAGCLNSSFAGWRAGVINAVTNAMLHDLQCALGGPLRRIRFDAPPGSLCTAEFPGAVANSTNFVIMLTVSLAAQVLGKMMISDESQRASICASGGSSNAPISGMSGINQRGEPWGGLHMEIPAGALGGFALNDGIPTGGTLWSYGTRMPDAETEEQDRPILFLYRSELKDSGGAGRWARGVGPVAAQVTHGADQIRHDVSACGFAIPTSAGLFGGYPGASNLIIEKRNSNVRDFFAKGVIPDSLESLDGDLTVVQPKLNNLRQGTTDVHEFRLSAGGGYGDPLLREPERVQEDVGLGYVSREAAADMYGVVIDSDGKVEGTQTEARRLQIRTERIGRPPPRAISESDGHRVSEYLVLKADAKANGESEEGIKMHCRMCGTAICGITENYKDAVVYRRLPISAGGSMMNDPSLYVDVNIEFRQFICPGCATLLETEVACESDAVLRDIELSPV